MSRHNTVEQKKKFGRKMEKHVYIERSKLCVFPRFLGFAFFENKL